MDAKREETAAETLARLYPKLFTDVPCGVTIERGWVPLVCRCVDELNAEGFDFQVDQCKEKLGSLRLYIDPYDKRSYAIVTRYEKESAAICEFCGAPGTLTSGGWVKTLCPAHAEEWGKRK